MLVDVMHAVTVRHICAMCSIGRRPGMVFSYGENHGANYTDAGGMNRAPRRECDRVTHTVAARRGEAPDATKEWRSRYRSGNSTSTTSGSSL
ncbi:MULTISPECIES: hypothetical protein [Burkholderiaceae]|uniref:hypothetical protein n=1 Tax=Burkholderiaceae TaxID=119060 RepID=UPI0025705A84|nr:hypothetical protein [Burkholderia sp. b13]